MPDREPAQKRRIILDPVAGPVPPAQAADQPARGEPRRTDLRVGTGERADVLERRPALDAHPRPRRNGTRAERDQQHQTGEHHLKPHPPDGRRRQRALHCAKHVRVASHAMMILVEDDACARRRSRPLQHALGQHDELLLVEQLIANDPRIADRDDAAPTEREAEHRRAPPQRQLVGRQDAEEDDGVLGQRAARGEGEADSPVVICHFLRENHAPLHVLARSLAGVTALPFDGVEGVHIIGVERDGVSRRTQHRAIDHGVARRGVIDRRIRARLVVARAVRRRQLCRCEVSAADLEPEWLHRTAVQVQRVGERRAEVGRDDQPRARAHGREKRSDLRRSRLDVRREDDVYRRRIEHAAEALRAPHDAPTEPLRALVPSARSPAIVGKRRQRAARVVSNCVRREEYGHDKKHSQRREDDARRKQPIEQRKRWGLWVSHQWWSGYWIHDANNKGLRPASMTKV